MWTFLYHSFCEYVFISFGKIPKNDTDGFYSKHLLNFIRNTLFFKNI